MVVVVVVGWSPTISSGKEVPRREAEGKASVDAGGVGRRGRGGGILTISSGRVALWSALMVMALNPRATTALESPAQWRIGVRN